MSYGVVDVTVGPRGGCHRRHVYYSLSYFSGWYALFLNEEECGGPGDNGHDLPGCRLNVLTHAMTYSSQFLCLSSKK